MRHEIDTHVDYNSYDYFEKVLMTDNGFREYDVRWRLGTEINPNGFLVLGRAYGTFIQENLSEDKVVVGHDFRSYSQDLCRSLVVGLLSTGVNVIDVGLALTPMVYLAQYKFCTKAAAIVTASHNENGWTGLKLADGLSSTLGPDGIKQFRRIIEMGQYRYGNGSYESRDNLFDLYRNEISSYGKVQHPIKVVVATGNGTAGRFAPNIFRDLGCVVFELNTDPDWTFPRFNPNPENIEFLKAISKTTLEQGADIGIGIDGDGDRMGVIDNLGREVYSDKLGLLLARWICPKYPGRNVVIDVKSTGLFYHDPVLSKAGTNVTMWKTGHSYIKAKVAEVNAIAGFEKSGHWFFREPLGRGYDDAILSGVHVIRMLDEINVSLAQVVDDLPTTWQSPTLGVYCVDGVKYKVVDWVTEQYRVDQKVGTIIGGSRIKDVVTVNGVRFILEDDSWGLVRASSNLPSLVLVAESMTSEDQLYEIMNHIQSRLAQTGEVGEYDQQMLARSGGK